MPINRFKLHCPLCIGPKLVHYHDRCIFDFRSPYADLTACMYAKFDFFRKCVVCRLRHLSQPIVARLQRYHTRLGGCPPAVYFSPTARVCIILYIDSQIHTQKLLVRFVFRHLTDGYIVFSIRIGLVRQSKGIAN